MRLKLIVAGIKCQKNIKLRPTRLFNSLKRLFLPTKTLTAPPKQR